MRVCISNLVDLLQSRAAECPDRPAYAFVSGSDLGTQTVTYSRLDCQARGVAALLQDLGLRGERVLLLYPPGLEFISGFWGCLYASAIAVPAYPPRLNRNALRVVSIAEDSQSRMALTTAAIASRLSVFSQHTPEFGRMRWVATDTLDPALAANWRAFSPAQESLAYLQYTSGSTVAPRGVMVTHANVLHNSAYIAAGFEHSADSVSLCWLPHFHDMGLIDGIIQPLYSGFTGYLMSPASFLQEPARWLQAISRFRVTHSGGPNFAYELCCAKVTAEQQEGLDLSSWKVAYNGAEPVHARTLELFAEQFGSRGFGLSAFYPAYGLAEATLKVSGGKKGNGPTYFMVKTTALEQNRVEVTQTDDPEGRTLVGAGQTAYGVKAVIVDPESHRECSAGEVGEIWIAGPSVALGYWNRQEESKEIFAASLKSTGEGPFLRTGDLGFLHDGEIFVTGRLKDLIIIRGRNHYPHDIEGTVQRSHPILRGMVGAAFSVQIGTDERIAIVQEIDSRRPNLLPDALEVIRRAVAEEHEVQPHAIVLVKYGSVPRTSSGKVQRQLCRQQFLANSFKSLAAWRELPDAETYDDAVPPELTADSLQLWLRAKFARKLRTSISEVDAQRPIHQLGLDSMMAMEISHSIEAALGISLSQSSLLEGWTVAELADHILSPSDPSALNVNTAVVKDTEISTRYPLSQGQRALWFLQQLAPQSRAYYIARALRLRNEIDGAVLQRTLQKLVDRHASLHAVFTLADGKPVQDIGRQASISFQHQDASQWNSIELSQRLAEAANAPFDLSGGPLFRVLLFSRSADDHVLLIAVHHIVSDLWSLGLVLNELSEIYAAEIRGVPPELPSLIFDYSGFVKWEEDVLRSEEAERHWQYWQKQLQGDLPYLELPIDFPRPSVQTYNGATKFARLDAELVCKLKSTAVNYRATPHTLLLSLFQTFLHRYSGQDDVLVGTPTSGRSRPEFTRIVGYFVNPVIIRMDFSEDPNFEQIMMRGRRAVLEALEHQAFPFPTLVQRLQPQRDSSRSPLFQAMFVLQRTSLPDVGLAALALGAPETQVRLGDLILESVALDQGTAQFDLTLAMAESGNEMVATFEYNADLFEAATVDRMMDHFDRLVRSCMADPAKPISEILFLSDQEYGQVVLEWNQTKHISPGFATVLDLLEFQAQRTPDNPAVIFEAERLSYRELHQQANQVAHFLRKLGVGPEVPVGACMQRSTQMVIALLSIMKAGGAYVPLDPSYPTGRLNYMLHDAHPAVVVVDKNIKEQLDSTGAHLVCLEEEWAAISAESRETVASKVSSENLAYVIYTSGSTGQPKGVMNVHGGLLNRLQWMQETYSLDKSDRILQKTPFGFDVSVWEFFWPLMCGACLVVARPEGHKDSQYLVQTIQQEGITTLHFVPSMLAVFLQEKDVERCSSLRRVVASGEALSAPLVETFHECLQWAELHNLYGPTEASIDVSWWNCSRAQEKKTTIPIGRPIANTQLYILDMHMQPMPVGVAGELYIGGVALARGYWRQVELTADKFVPDPFSGEEGGRLYRTGDLARWRRDGEIEYLGRLDTQVKLRGFRIELGEIERVLTQHEALQQAVVALQEAGKEKRLIAYVVPAAGIPLSIAAIRTYLQEKLPEYMMPATIVELQALPLSAHGKVNRKALPKWEFAVAQPEYRPPPTPTEELLRGIWNEALGVARIGIHDNFFELGGHSLLATQIMSRVREIFLIDLPLHSIFETPTIAGLSKKIDRAKSAGRLSISVPIFPAKHGIDAPLSFAQERMWFLHQIIPDKSVYNIIEGLRLTGELNVGVLEVVLNDIISRHEVLRASFASVDGRCVQTIAPAPGFHIEKLDLQRQRSPEEVRWLVYEQTRKIFDLNQAPLLRATLVRSGEDEHILLLVMHHLISDGWSFSVLLRELTDLYRARLRNDKPTVRELQIQYADYAQWQRRHLAGDALASHLNYWRTQLAGADGELLVPADHPRPVMQTFRGRRYSFEFSESFSDSLKELSRQQSVTLFMTLLAGLKLLLARYGSRQDITVGSVVANRNHREVEDLIGLFANTLVLRTEISRELRVVDVLRRVREVCIGAYLHQEVPFEKLVAELEPERDLSRSPLFQVMCAWQILPGNAWQMEGFRLTRLAVEEESETTKFDLSFLIGENQSGLIGVIEYSSDLFEGKTIRRMFVLYRRVLEEMVRESNQNVWELSLLNEEEREQLLAEWNRTAREYPADQGIQQLFEEQVRRVPQNIAVVFQDRKLSYTEVNRQANQVAHYLRKHGVGLETRVGVYTERSVEMIVAVLGIVKAGGVYVALDAGSPPERLELMLAESSSRVVVTQQSLRRLLPEKSWMRIVCLDEEWENIAGECCENPDTQASGGNLAYVSYTSGSTGKPKGVSIPHRAVARLVKNNDYAQLSAEEVILQFAPLPFDASTLEIWGSLLNGGRLVMMPSGLQSIEEIGRALVEYEITTAWLTAGLFHVMVDHQLENLKRVRQLLAGGDVLSVAHVWRYMAQAGENAVLINGYGPTENTTFTCCYQMRKGSAVEETVPIGTPIGNTQVYVLNEEMHPVAVGAVGELYIGGEGLARGYENDAALTAERFVPHPYGGAGERLYRSGDEVRWRRDGVMEFVGRVDRQVKVRGYRVEPAEIECVMMRHERVLEAVVTVQQKEAREKSLIVYVVARKDGELSVPELQSYLKSRLPGYMLPAAIVMLDKLPLTANGKVDLKALPVPETSEVSGGLVSPRTDTEARLAEIWKGLLRLERVSVHDNFFELGGDSIISLQIVARAQQQGIRITARQLFESPTIAALAAVAEPVHAGQEEIVVQNGIEADAVLKYSLSPLQKGMLFEYLSAPELGVYVQQLICIVRGRLESEAFQNAWQRVVARHTVLRTRFAWEGVDEPLQEVSSKVVVPFDFQDWSEISESDQQQQLRAVLAADRARGFTLSEAPLVRITVLQTAPDVCQVLFTFHHLILDGWSLPLLFQEVFARYGEQIAGESHAEPLVDSYSKYIQWLQNRDLAAAETYWRQMLEGFSAPTSLGIRATTRPFNDRGDVFFEQQIQFSGDETLQLQSLAKQHGTTLSILMQTAWAILLSHYSGEEDIVFGLTLSGRSANLPGIEEMIGLFINTLPVRSRVTAEQKLLPWLKEFQARQMDLTQYEHTPLSQVQKWSEIPAGKHLFESIFVFENYPLDASLLDQNNDLRIEDVEAVDITNYPLTVTAVPHSDLKLFISYECRRFDDAAVRRMLDHMRTILLGMAAAPQQCIGEVVWITPAERAQLLLEWSRTVEEPLAEESIHGMFEEQVRRSPNEIAVTFGAQQMTYRELDQRANQLANYLRHRGVKPESCVGFCVERSMETVIGVLGILKAGGVYVPIDPSWPTQRKASILAEIHAPLLLTSQDLHDEVRDLAASAVYLDSKWEQINNEESCAPDAPVDPNSLAYIIHTSGTTGKPKGVMISHRALCNHVRWMQAAFPLTREDRIPQKYSLSFDVSVLEVFYPLAAGATLIVAPPTDYFDSSALVTFLSENRITAIDLVPAMLQALVQDERFKSLTALRQVTCGGDVLPHDLQEEFFSRTQAELANLYGPTEATIGSTFWRCRLGQNSLSVPIGRPIANSEAYILDRNMGPVAIGITGELYIGGTGLARGYLNEAVLTAEKFIPHVYSRIPGERLYRTGDLGRYREDGNIEFLGRADQQVKIRGYRIEPAEIESVLRTHPAVRDSVVVAHDARLVAYVAGVQCDQNSLHQYLKQSLPEYMIPAHFVFLDSIPTLPNGKVDRRALPAPKHLSTPKTYVGPRDLMEEALVAIWAAVLKAEQVGIEDNFFELGGDSIISLQVLARAHQQGIRITPRQLFESPTVAALAVVAEWMEGDGKLSGSQAEIEGDVALTPIQHWFFEQQLEQPEHYNHSVMVKAAEELNEGWLAEAWKRLVEHHDALRLRYWRDSEEWRQKNSAKEENEFFRVVELKGDEEERKRELERTIEQMQQSLNLEQGPLLRVALVKPDRMVVVIHHLAVDGVSWRILLEDLETAYAQLRCGKQIRLPGKTSSYQQWAEQLEHRAKENRYARELEYWLRGDREAREKLPRDLAGGENIERNREYVRVELDEEQTHELLHQAPKAYRTQINDVLLTAVMGAWEKWTGKQGLRIDVEGHGRDGELDLSRTVGWFTAVYPVTLEVVRAEGIGERLKGIKEQLRKVPAQGVGYGILRYLTNDRTVRDRLRTQTKPEISFNYLGQVDAGICERGVFRSLKPILENSRGKRNRRSHLLEVEGRVESGRLLVEWNYSSEVHRLETIEALARNFVNELKEIIRHCVTPGVGGFTPSDFPLAGIDQQTLDLLIQDSGSISDIYPLSPVQQGLLFHTLYDDPRSGTYIEQLSCTLEGDINLAAFEGAWQEVIQCHPVLRSGFFWEGLQEPLQIVHPSARALFIHHDWRQSPGDAQLRFDALRRADAEQGFDLASPPLMRFTLAQLPGTFEFLWSSHHLVLDGWSMALVVQEVFERYEAICNEKSFHATRPRPYRDHIAWIGQQALTEAREYWEWQLKGFSASITLPGKRAVPTAMDKEYREHKLVLPENITSQLQTISRQNRIMLSVLVQAAWGLLLKHYTGQPDLMFGVTVSGRPPELTGVDEMVGMFINTLPLRLKLVSESTVLSVLKELQATQLRLDQFAYTPLSRIQEWSEIPAGLPLFETILVFENYPVDSSLRNPRGGLKFSRLRSWATTNYPLTLIVKPGPELTLQLSYDVRCFESSVVSQLLTHLQNLLNGIATDPMQRVADIQPLSHAEQQQLLVEWNRTASEYPRDQGIQQLFEEQVQRVPQNVAVVFKDQKLSYAELNRQANQLAHYLRKHGVGLETRVGVCMERSLQTIVALLGIVKAGSVYVAMDAGSPPERLEMMLGESGSRVVVTQKLLRGVLPKTPGMQIVNVDEERETIAAESSENPETHASGEHLAYVSYTSGSTGRPKGVSVPHRAVVRLVKNNDYARLSELEVILQFAPLAFDASTLEIWGSLLNGGRLVVMPSGPQSIEEIGRVLVEYGITTAWLTAGLFHVMVDHQLDKLKHVRQLLAGGDVLSVAHVNRYLHDLDQNAVLINGYGPTENTTFTCCYQMRTRAAIEETVPIGRPIRNTQVYVLNEEMQPVALGVVGELYIGGEGLARGYEDDAVLTAERFVPHPYGEAGERLYRSGDEVRWRRDGLLEFVGRLDRQVKVRGYRVEPAEIECVMMRHEDVREAVVTVQERRSKEKSLIAYVVAQPNGKLSIPDLQAYLKPRLPDYMRPAAIVLLDKLPLTANGKVDLKALPAPETLETSGGVVLPRTPVEHALAEIWRQVFGIDRLSVEDNFFHLGGNSLLGLKIASRVRTALGVALPLRSIFEEPTIADQARTVERLLGSGRTAPPLEIQSLHRPDVLPLSFGQQRLWFLHQLEPTSDFYNVPIALRLHGPLDADVLRECCNEIARRHEILRTSFPIRNGVPVQQIDEAVQVPLEITDLSRMPSEQAEAEAREIISRDARRQFDLSSGPLFRLSLLRLGKEEHVLLLNMHHIVVDGWSLEIFTRELAVLYQAFLGGHSSPLHPLSLQYADYALWQREWLSGEPLESELTYWRQQLAGVCPLELRTDYPRPKVQTFRGAKISIQLSREFAEFLTELARREHSTLFMVLLAALKVLLYRYTGQPEITVGTPVAGRAQQETEGLIGFFVNTLALRTKVVGAPRFAEFLRQVREISLGAYSHQDLPFEKLVEELHPERDDGRSPIFQVMFALEHTLPQGLILAGLQTSPIEIENQIAQFDLTLTIREAFHGLRISFQYNNDLFYSASIERMMQHFERLLRGIAANPQQSIAEIPLLTEEEHRQLVLEWNQTERSYPAFATVLDLLEAQAQRTPDNPAVIFEGERLSYRELNQQANQLAHFLQKLGVGPEVPVGVCMQRSTRMVIALLGIMKAGGAYVPLDPGYPAERLKYMLHDARPVAVLTQSSLRQALPEFVGEIVCLDDDYGIAALSNERAPLPLVKPENAVYVIYTSGSTGVPKGVVVQHGSLFNYLLWIKESLLAGGIDCVPAVTSLAFDASLKQILAPLLVGGAVYVCADHLADPAKMLTFISSKHRVALNCVPSFWLLVLEEMEKNPQGVPDNLVELWLGGENFTPDLIQRSLRVLPDLKISNLYGPTEATANAVYAERISSEHICIGKPIANTEAYVLDQWGGLAPVGVPGELYIGGAGLARGYINQPGHTADRFLPDLFSKTPGSRLYRTGDLVRREPGGDIEFLGRIDHQVKLRGYRIELGEIEALLRQHPEVSQAAVVLREDEPDDKRLMGFAVAKNATDGLFAHNIRDYLKTKLPEYMIPEIVQVNQIPITINGKIDYNSLPVTSSGSSSTPRVYVAPRNAIEEQLEKACCDLLGIQRMSVHDNFFDSGGHSLLAMRLMTWTRETFRIDAIPLREFFETPTIAGLAALSLRCETRPGQTEKIANFLQQLNAMSAEQVMALRSKDKEQEAAKSAVSQH